LKKTIIGYYLSLLARERLNSYSIREEDKFDKKLNPGKDEGIHLKVN